MIAKRGNGTGLIIIHIHEVKSIENNACIEFLIPVLNNIEHFLRIFQHFNAAFFRENKLKLCKLSIELFMCKTIIPFSEPGITVFICISFNQGSTRIGRHFRGNGRTGNHKLNGIMHANQYKKFKENVVVDNRNRNSEKTSEKVSDNGFCLQAPDIVMAHDIKTINQRNNRKRQPRIIGRRNAKGFFQTIHTNYGFQQNNRNTGIHEGIT